MDHATRRLEKSPDSLVTLHLNPIRLGLIVSDSLYGRFEVSLSICSNNRYSVNSHP